MDAPGNRLWSVELSSLWRIVMEEHDFDTREGSGGQDGFNMEGGSGEDGDKVRTLQRSLQGEWEIVDCMIPHGKHIL